MHVGCVSSTRQLGGSCSGSVLSSHVLVVCMCKRECLQLGKEGNECNGGWCELKQREERRNIISM
jgi:hypothetical protein